MEKTTKAKTSKTNFNKLMKHASAGDRDAASRLADAYRTGDRVAQSWEQAFRWYTVAANAGDAEAQNNLGTFYLEGHYCPEDLEKAVYWYRKSAEQGANVAQYNLGMRYIHGQGVPADDAQAMRWLEKSAEQGYAIAYFDLALMHLHGEGCKPDRAKALRLMMEGALGDDERAVATLIERLPELEELALDGDISDWLTLSDLFYGHFNLPDSQARGWAWLLWAEARFASHPGFDFAVAGRLFDLITDSDKRGCTPVADKEKGAKLFKAMLLERGNALPLKPPANMVKKTHSVRLPEKWREVCAADAPAEKRFSKTRPDFELILGLAAEGGGLDVFGKPANDGTWSFWSDMNDWTPTLEDGDAIHRTTDLVESWDAAIAVLDEKFPYWMDLYPCYVHPEFRKPMQQLIERRQIVKRLVRNSRG